MNDKQQVRQLLRGIAAGKGSPDLIGAELLGGISLVGFIVKDERLSKLIGEFQETARLINARVKELMEE